MDRVLAEQPPKVPTVMSRNCYQNVCGQMHRFKRASAKAERMAEVRRSCRVFQCLQVGLAGSRRSGWVPAPAYRIRLLLDRTPHPGVLDVSG